ncbi:hypothetical protein FALBO_1456 [Fusarium albosuccineum]|uniref:Uncharacterized protein n=1 Tax=Fusarium albosuccineum TaxID=1237068 RepID=A0A8H4LMW9_9HYPO|nr:hypothetical protein FALBO_1456 [Fusarium albosuccineum]
MDRGQVDDDGSPPEGAHSNDEIDNDTLREISNKQGHIEARSRDEAVSLGSRQPTLTVDQAIVEGYRGAPIPEDDDAPIEMSVSDPGKLTVYGELRLSDGSMRKKLGHRMEAVRVMARAGQLFLPRDATDASLEDRVDLDLFANEGKVQSTYVGISGITLQPAFMRPRAGDFWSRMTGEMEIVSEPSQQRCDRNTIMHEGATVAGNLTKIKRMLLENDIQFVDEPHPKQKVLTQNARVILCIPAEPVMNIRPTATGRGQPTMWNLYKEEDGSDSHYNLRVPYLGLLSPSSVLLESLKALLDAHPSDPIPLNIALQAAFVWTDIERDQNRQIEGYGRLNGRIQYPVPYVPLEVFIIYYPHWLRFHEVFKLTRYIHPYRFIHMAYRLDQKRSARIADELRVRREGLVNGGRISTLIQSVQPKTAYVSPQRRITLLPASWPGTKMFWPRQVGSGEPPGDALAEACLLNDIRTLGIPSYHPRDTSYLLVGIPRPIADITVRQPGRVRMWVPENPPQHIWAPYEKGTLVAVSGDAASVGPVFRDIQAAGVLCPLQPLDSDIAMPDMEELVPAPVRIALNARNTIRLRLIKALDISMERVQWDTNDLILTWEGIQQDVADGLANGTLANFNFYLGTNFFADEPPEPEPPRARPRLSEEEFEERLRRAKTETFDDDC